MVREEDNVSFVREEVIMTFMINAFLAKEQVLTYVSIVMGKDTLNALIATGKGIQ